MTVEVFKANSTAEKFKAENEILLKDIQNLKNMLDSAMKRVNELISEQNDMIQTQNMDNSLKNGSVIGVNFDEV